jgi:hypothetical protein
MTSFRNFQFQPKRKKCKNVKSQGVASGSNAVSYMSFVGAVITLVLNINNNINGVSFLLLRSFPIKVVRILVCCVRK